MFETFDIRFQEDVKSTSRVKSSRLKTCPVIQRSRSLTNPSHMELTKSHIAVSDSSLHSVHTFSKQY
jgi:head-tail adaptor